MSARSLVVITGVLMLLGQQRHARAQDVPQNGWVVWESNRADGRREVYFMKADGTGVKRLTTTGARIPRWSPDGRWIAYQDIVDSSTHLIRWDGSEPKHLFDGTPYFWMHDNSGLLCRLGDDFFVVDPDSGDKTLLFKQSDFTQLNGKMMEPGGITADRRWMVAGSDRYRDGYIGDNGPFSAGFAAVVLDLEARDKVYFFGSGCGPAAAPEGSRVYHVCGDLAFCANKPDIYTMDLADLATRSSYAPVMNHTDDDWGHEYFPKISNDNQWLIYAASTGCHDQEYCDYEIFVHRLSAGPENRTRLTYDDKNDQYPSLYIGELWKPQAQPKLGLSPDRLAFNLLPGEKPVAQNVVVKNLGGGSLETVTTKVTYSSGSGWLDVAASGSGNQQQLAVALKESGLVVGQHKATLEVSAASAEGSPVRCEITVTIASPLPSPDGGVGPVKPSSGCSMSTAPATGGPAALAGLAGILLIGLARFRRR